MEATATVKVTPKMMAEAFWNMEGELQIEFLKELAEEINRDEEDGNTGARSLGEVQWFYTCKELEKPENSQAREMLMTIAAPLYMHTLMACDKW